MDVAELRQRVERLEAGVAQSGMAADGSSVSAMQEPDGRYRAYVLFADGWAPIAPATTDPREAILTVEAFVCGSFVRDQQEVNVDGIVDARGIRFIGKARRQTDGTWRCLADVAGNLCVVEVRLSVPLSASSPLAPP